MARRVNDRGTVSLMNCRGNIRASKGAFQNFKAEVFMTENLPQIQNFQFCHHFRLYLKGL